MLIQFERRGGFTGIRKESKLDTESLPPETAQELLELIKKADFFNQPENFPAPKRGADYFHYKLTIEKEGKKHTVEVSDPAAPVSLQPLLKFLSKY